MGENIEKRRKRNNAWQKRNFKLIGAKLYREDAEEFEAYCKEKGMSVNAVLREYIVECIGRPLTIRSEIKTEEKEGNDNEE